MKEDYLIKVTGIQEIDGESDKVEIITAGTLMYRDSKFLIKYCERDNDDPRISIDNSVLVNGNSQVTVIRNFGGESRLILEKGRRHQCIYTTIAGDLSVGVYTDYIKNTLTPDVGGKLSLKYSLDFNAGLVSSNELHITITKKEV
ncbi:MAG: DUF1934 domain-containing protein [Clostridia bacterium]|nr:DUF1934 domain-containing protein [Clostridia bacterium]